MAKINTIIAPELRKEIIEYIICYFLSLIYSIRRVSAALVDNTGLPADCAGGLWRKRQAASEPRTEIS